MKGMTYKGYAARAEFDGDDNIFFGRLAGIRDGVTFHEAVDDYVETCAKIGKDPQKPYSGNLMLRVDPEVHSRAALAAELAAKSLNEWGEDVISKAAESTYAAVSSSA